MWKRLYGLMKRNYVYSITLALAFIMMIGAWIIGDVGPFGGRCLIVVDGVHQYLPFFSEYQEKLQNFESLQFSFDVGMGNNFLSLWSYYLSSPLNLIVMLCTKSGLPMAMNIIISTKIILAAFCFAYFLMHAGNKPKQNPGMIVFSLFYAFSSFVIGYYWNLMWLDCVFIFPIVILGMERLMRDGDSKTYILALLYSFICNYYISFMICIFLVLWFFTFHFDSVKQFFARGIRFAIASLTAAAMGAVVLIPAYEGIMTTASAEFEFPKWEFYGEFVDTLRSHLFCSEVMTNQVGDSGTNLYCGLFTLLLAIIFFFVGKISLEKKIKYILLLVLFVISFNNQLLNYIWHGFHNQYGIPNRFAFLYVFVLILMAYEVYLKRRRVRLPMIVVAYVVCMLYIIYAYYNAKVVYDVRTYIASGVLLTIYLLMFVLYKKLPGKWKRMAGYSLVVIAVVEMAINGWIAFVQVGTSDAEYYYGETKTFETLIDRVEANDDGWYRADMLQPNMVDEATWHNLPSIGIFGSTVPGEMVTTMGDLGFYTGANEYLYYGATPFTNALFGVKYVYTREGDFANADMGLYDTEDNVSVYKNLYNLPIGYMVNREILDFETLDNGPFTVQNELSGVMTGVEPIFSSIFDDMQTTTYGTNVEVTLKDEFNASYKSANGSARADIIYTIPHDMDLYVNCSGSNVHKIALLIDGNEVAFDRYHGQLFRVGEVKKGQVVDIQFVLNEGDDLSGTLYCYPMEFLDDQFGQAYSILSNQSMHMTKFSDTKIEGTITAMKDGVFMTSIPYDEGWTVYANGEKVETCRILESFLGVELPKGDYTIKMVYQCPGLMKGLITTLFGILCFFLICKVEKRMRKQTQNIIKG